MFQDINQICENDRAEKLRLLQAQEEHIKDKKEEFGLDFMTPESCGLEQPTDGIAKGIISTHKDFGRIAEAIQAGKPWAVVSGINPSGPLHLGHLALFKENLELQKIGAELFIPISNDESFLFDKAPSLETAEKIAWEDVIPDIIALGFDPEKTHIYVDSDFPSIYTFALYISKHFSLNQIKGVFGFTDDSSPAYTFYMGGIQMAHILMPQLPEYGGVRPTIVPVGIDQHPYIQISRRFARRAGMIPPAELNLKFLPSLAGPEHKMSASAKNTCIYVTDTIDEVKEKIKTAYTGGSPMLKYQKEHGGIPEVCSIYGIMLYHMLDKTEADQIAESCRKGEKTCRECKEQCLTGLETMLKEHQEKRKAARALIDKFLLKQPIKSFRSCRIGA